MIDTKYRKFNAYAVKVKYYLRQAVSRGGRGYPRILGRRSVSPHPLSPGGVVPINQKATGPGDKRKTVRQGEKEGGRNHF